MKINRCWLSELHAKELAERKKLKSKISKKKIPYKNIEDDNRSKWKDRKR